jgi:hypothetical protein
MSKKLQFIPPILLLTAFVWALSGACATTPFTLDHCEVTADCHSESQDIPGTVCRNNWCVCEDPSWRGCCDKADETPNGECAASCKPCSECRLGSAVVCGLTPECVVDPLCGVPSDGGVPGAETTWDAQ